MNVRPHVLGIETSCDETAAAVVNDRGDVLSSVVATQEALHAKYRGVVPELAARAHVERIAPVIEEALRRAGVTYADIGAVAVTEGPGLVGSLMIGVAAAKVIALVQGVPLVGVDHIAAHATSAALAAPESDCWPSVALVVSGGHTSIYHVVDGTDIRLLGQTHDDAAGEAADKVAAILDLGFPGGPSVERLARGGNPLACDFPRAWLDRPTLDFSFSGLKTAVLYEVYGRGRKYGSTAHLPPSRLADIAASFQAALVEPLVVKTIAAAERIGVRHVCVGGGVAANELLRTELQQACAARGFHLTLTPKEYCTDNAAMIAALGLRLWRAGAVSNLALEPRAGLRRPGR